MEPSVITDGEGLIEAALGEERRLLLQWSRR